jgi:hypothetical protein
VAVREKCCGGTSAGGGGRADAAVARRSVIRCSGAIDAIEIHHVVPLGDEVARELILRLVARIDLGERDVHQHDQAGIIMSPLALDELTRPRERRYPHMIEGSVARRAGTPDEGGAVGALRRDGPVLCLLMEPDAVA